MFKLKQPVNSVYTDTSDEPYFYTKKTRIENVKSVPWKIDTIFDANSRWNYGRESVHVYSAKQFINDFINNPLYVDELDMADRRKVVIAMINRDEDQRPRDILKQYMSSYDLYVKHGRFRQIDKYLDSLCDSVRDLTTLSKLTSDWSKKADARHLSKFGKASLDERQEKRFKAIYLNFFRDPVCNAEGLPLEGSCLADSSLVWRIDRKDKAWTVRLDYGNSRETFKIDQEWKKNVGYNGLAVSDRKIVTCAFPREKLDVNGIPMIIYKALWFQRKSNPTGLIKKDGYIVRLGYKDNPISIKTTEHYSQCRKIAENSATREFFKRMVNSD